MSGETAPSSTPVDAAESSLSSTDMKSQTVKGMTLMIGAMLLLPMMDILSRALSNWYDTSPGTVAFGRFAIQVILLAIVLLVLKGPSSLIANRIVPNLFRGMLIALASLLFFITVKYMPVADAMAVFFIEPFILTVLSALVLKEHVGWRRRIAVLIGFAGALIVIQPSYEVFGPVSLLPICTAVLFAVYLLLTRPLTAQDEPITMQFTSGVGATLTMSVVLLMGPTIGFDDLSPTMPQNPIAWAMIFGIGALAAFGHLAVTHAFKLADVSLLAPFQYVEIISATLFGFIFFGDFPEPIKWLGIAIIVGSGLYLFWRERQIEMQSND